MGDSQRHLEEDQVSHKRGASSAFGGLRDFVFVDGVPISEDEYTRLYPSKKPVHESKEHVNHFIFPGQDVAEDVRLPVDDEFRPLSPGSIYRGPGDQRALSTKALEFVRKGAEGIASVSRTAAVEIAKVSRSTSMELQNLAAPVLAPIFQGVSDEGQGSEQEQVQRETPKPEELERMATPYVQPVARGRRRGRAKAPTSQKEIMMQEEESGGLNNMAPPSPPLPPPQAAVLPKGVSAPRVGESQ